MSESLWPSKEWFDSMMANTEAVGIESKISKKHKQIKMYAKQLRVLRHERKANTNHKVERGKDE